MGQRRADVRTPVLPFTVIRDAVADLPLPDPAVLREAATGDPTPPRHDALAARVPALRLVEARQPAPRPGRVSPFGGARPADRLRAAAWNLERCPRVEASAALLRRAGVDVALLSEMDLGMARSAHRHTARDLADLLGAGHAFGVEFVELGVGIGSEIARFAGRANTAALHGNALVSALPFRDPFIVRLDRGGAWFGLDWHHRRLGGRIAVGALVDMARGPVLVVSVHLENRSTPAERCAAMEGLLAALPSGIPAIVAGDLNTSALPELSTGTSRAWFERPESAEPLFGAMREGGFDWLRCNAPDQTRRIIPDGRPAPGVRRVDWFFTRGLDVSSPRTWAAVDDDDGPLSDHELITVDIA